MSGKTSVDPVFLPDQPLRIGLIGYGYWGEKLARNLMGMSQVQLVTICDGSDSARRAVSALYPGVLTCVDPEELFNQHDLNAIVIATPPTTHYPLALAALESGHHVFVEKPMTTRSRDARHLIEVAARWGKHLAVGHTFLFNGAVLAMRTHLPSLGQLLYWDSVRSNLGLIQQDANVIWDLAPHDFSIIDHLLKPQRVAVSAVGACHLGTSLENIAFVTLNFADQQIAHCQFNWLSPLKLRRTILGGNQRLMVWDDLETDEKIKIYNKGVDIEELSNPGNRQRFAISYRSGDMVSPSVTLKEALRTELEHFVHCLALDCPPINDGWSGLRVVQLLEATDQSLAEGGRPIPVELASPAVESAFVVPIAGWHEQLLKTGSTS